MGKKKKKGKETNSTNKDDTVVYKPVKKKGKKKKHPKLRLLLKILLITFILLIVICAGIFAAILYRCIWGDWAIDADDLTISYENSTIYDINGDVIATLSGDENREIISKEEMSEYLFDAFISIEDERFEEHNGVDWKRTLGALATFALNGGESSFGGSTITQQLVKNLTGEDDDTAIEGALRKIKEIVRAYQVENILSKDQILEMYLNLIPLGNVYGVQSASRYYFDKDAKDLTLVECAYLAGITNAPSTYNPFGTVDRTTRINDRVKTVLGKMLELGRITQEEYDAAIEEVNNGIVFTQGVVSQNNNLTYHAEAAVNEIVEDLMELNGWTKDEAKLHLFGDGYQIYTTYDPTIQESVEAQYIDNSSKWTTSYKTVTRTNSDGSTYTVQVREESAIVIIDYDKGYVVAGTSGYGEKTTAWGTNRMTVTTHNPGSCIKPLAVIGPCLEEGIITAASVVDDTPVTYGNYSPRNYSYDYYGLMNIRYIIRVSRNIPEVKLLKKLTVSKALEYLEKFGIDTTGEEQDGLSLALGGMTYGMTVLEMAGAYATIANDGVYIEPTFYINVTDKDGNEIIGDHQETWRVLSEQNAYILKTILQETTGTGLTGTSGATGTAAKISGQATAGKTGTTNEKTAVWFAGFTNYYAAAVWMGYDYESEGSARASTYASRLWNAVMTPIHSGLESKTSFDQPSGITTATVCSKSGLLATDTCRNAGDGTQVYTEYFVSGTQPTSYCDCHVTAEVCNVSGKLASDNCTDTTTKIFITRENSSSDTSWKSASDAKYMLPTETCTECTGHSDDDDDDNDEEENNVTNENTVDNNTNTNTNSTNTAENNAVNNTTNTTGNNNTATGNNTTNTTGNNATSNNTANATANNNTANTTNNTTTENNTTSKNNTNTTENTVE